MYWCDLIEIETMKKRICVYCSSSNALDKVYFNAANELATLMAARNHSLVYGGTNVGLMGELARTIKSYNGEVIGIIPEKIRDKGIAFNQADILVVTKNMRERKAKMEEYADAIITLPGGFGTLEEIFEMITSKQLQFHNKPLVFLNVNNFYDRLFDFLEQVYAHNFAKPVYKELYYIANDVQSAIKYIEEYDYDKVIDTEKWFEQKPV